MRAGDLVAERFELVDRVGLGGMGDVWRAKDLVTERDVAFKVMLGLGDAERFNREAEILAELSHPSIVRYVAHGGRGQASYLAMEWIDGESLEARLSRGRLDVVECVMLAERVARGLAAAHDRGVVHRDIKPSNIMLREGRVDGATIVDFGIARAQKQVRALTRTGIAMGSPGYMAPEQARGERNVGPEADVFSLGCVLFECLTGEPAFIGVHVMAVLAKVLLEEAPRVRDLVRDIPVAIDTWIAGLLSKDPALRPRDGSAVLRQLEVASETASLPIESARPSARSRTIGASEAEMVAVAIAAPTRSLGDAATLVPGQTETSEVDSWVDEVEAHGARLVALADGTMVALVARGLSATDQAVAAARCALSLRRAFSDHSVGLAMGRHATNERIGRAIDRAVSLVQSAKPGRAVRVDDVVAGLLGSRFALLQEDDGYYLESESTTYGPIRTVLGRPTACVGRERDLGLLIGVFDGCVNESLASAALILGPPGIGKSRLVEELSARIDARTTDVLVLRASADPMRSGPFALVAEALRRSAGIVGSDPVEARRARLTELVAKYVHDDARAIAEMLGEIVGAPFPEEESVKLFAARRDAQLGGDGIRRAFEDLLRAAAEAGPVLLLLEDLHWGDLPSIRLVDSALRVLTDCSLLVVGTARPEVDLRFPSLWQDRSATVLRLGPLPKRAAETLARQVLGPEVPEGVVKRVAARAGGNPLLLEELLRAAAAGETDEIPETVLAIVEARLTALPPDARRLLRAASIFGDTFWSGGVLALAGDFATTATLDGRLEAFTKEELVRQQPDSRYPGQREYVFGNEPLRAAAYATLTEEDRLLGHRLAALWLAEVGEPDAATRAAHFEKGGEPEAAAIAYLEAARQALVGYDLESALAFTERGSRCSPNTDVAASLAVARGQAHRWRAEYEASRDAFSVAVASLKPGSSSWWEAKLGHAYALAFLNDSGALDRSAAILRETEPDIDADRAAASARLTFATHLLIRGRTALAEALVKAAPEAPLEDAALGATRLRFEGFAASFRGDFEGALAAASSARERAEAAGDLRSAARDRLASGVALIYLGQYVAAEAHLLPALAIAERIGLVAFTAAAKSDIGLAIVRLGRLDEAARLQTEACRAFREHGDQRMEGSCAIYLADVLLLAKELDRAEEEARRATQLLVATSSMRPQALAVLADVLRARGRVDEANAAAAEAFRALELAEVVEEGEIRVRVVWAEALQSAGEIERAQEIANTTRAMVLARADKIRSAELRESFLSKVTENARALSYAAG